MLERSVPCGQDVDAAVMEVLAARVDGLCPCAVRVDDSTLHFEFDPSGMRSVSEVVFASRADRLRFLGNVAELAGLVGDYEFSLDPENLVVDANLRPRVLIRKALTTGCVGELDYTDFMMQWLALCGAMLTDATFAQFANGGTDRFSHDLLLAELADLAAVSVDGSSTSAVSDVGVVGAVRDRLWLASQRNQERTQATTRRVGRGKWWALMVAVPVLAVGTAVGAVLTVMSAGNAGMLERIVEASQAYVVSDFVGAQRALAGVPAEDMSFETRHLLARSYAFTAGLDVDQRAAWDRSLTRQADGILFDYWIHLGRLQFDEALLVAQRAGDPELVLFVYISQHAFVEANLAMDPAVRSAELTRLSGIIVRLRAELEQAGTILPDVVVDPGDVDTDSNSAAGEGEVG